MKTTVIGLGIGLAHVAGYLRSPHSELVRVCDLQPERLTHLGGTFDQGSMRVLEPLFTPVERASPWEALGITPTTDLDAILNDPTIELVSLCTPDYTHADLAQKILRAGKHLLLEKPLALNLDDARTVLRCGGQMQKRIAVDYEFRVNPAVQKLRRLVTDGTLGTIRAFALYHYRTPFRRDKWNHWIQSENLSGGLLIEETCHWFDLAEFISGNRITSVHAVGTDAIHPDFDYEDLAFVQGTYADGSVYQISHALTGFDFSLVIQLHGDCGSAWCGLKEASYSALDDGASPYLGIVSHAPQNALPSEAHIRTYGTEATEPENIRVYTESVVEALENDTPFVADQDAGLRSLLVALAAREALKKGEIVTI